MLLIADAGSLQRVAVRQNRLGGQLKFVRRYRTSKRAQVRMPVWRLEIRPHTERRHRSFDLVNVLLQIVLARDRQIRTRLGGNPPFPPSTFRSIAGHRQWTLDIRQPRCRTGVGTELRLQRNGDSEPSESTTSAQRNVQHRGRKNTSSATGCLYGPLRRLPDPIGPPSAFIWSMST